MVSDRDLLNFDHSSLPDGDNLNVAALLEVHGDLYRNHLAIALFLSERRYHLARQHVVRPVAEDGRFIGEDHTLSDMITGLRRGDFLPTGECLKELERAFPV
ncbi:hypothetical protein ACSMXN_15275 [Jatrophihabitans sp. DSM 45814]